MDGHGISENAWASGWARASWLFLGFWSVLGFWLCALDWSWALGVLVGPMFVGLLLAGGWLVLCFLAGWLVWVPGLLGCSWA